MEARAACPTMISPDQILRWRHVIVRRHVTVTRLWTSSDTRIASRFGCLDISLGPSGQQSTGLYFVIYLENPLEVESMKN